MSRQYGQDFRGGESFQNRAATMKFTGRSSGPKGKVAYNPKTGEEMKITSGAKMYHKGDSKGVSAWKKTKYGFITYVASFTGKKAKETTGKNGQQYITSIAVKITNVDTSQISYTWGVWSVTGNTLTMSEVGKYITLRNGGFVGKIKK